MNKLKPHTRNQRIMYRIDKLEERIYNLELVVGSLQLFYLRSSEYLNQLKFERDKEFVDMTHRNTELLEENKKYKEVIDKAIKKMQLLIVIGFDYDGFNQLDSFKTLIDELVGYAKESLNILKEVDKQMMNEEDIERGIKALYQMSKEKNFKSPTKKMTTITMNEMANEIEKLKNQQKEFIEYLENEIKRLENTEFYIESMQKAAIATHKHNLSKYKEIIGGKE